MHILFNAKGKKIKSRKYIIGMIEKKSKFILDSILKPPILN
jgi:hypothetical protein